MAKIDITHIVDAQPIRKVGRVRSLASKGNRKAREAIAKAIAHPRMPAFMKTKEGRKIFAIGFAAGSAGGAGAGGYAVHKSKKSRK